MRPRPGTPLIDIDTNFITDNINDIKDTNDSVLKNFSNFMKQIIENKNESSFLSGDKNIVKYVLSKYLNIPEENLYNLKKLSIIITNDYGLLNQFGNFLPQLKLLKLNNSNILNFNDIGTNFNNIICLQMKNCHLKNINGIICMQNLQIFDIENNEVSDLLDIDMCSKLRKIVLKKNNISDSDNLTFLSSITKLEYIDIRDNPICNDTDIDIGNILNDIKVVLWNDSHNNLSQDVVGKYSYTLKNVNDNIKKENQIEKEINNILKDNKESNNNIIINKIPIKKSKIQIDIVEKPISPLLNVKRDYSQNSKDNSNNINAFRSTLGKKQQLKPLKYKGGIDFFVDKSNGSSTSGGTHSSKEKYLNPFKIVVRDDDKKINPSLNKINIKPIKNKKI